MQDPYTAMMHRDERFFKPYGASVRSNSNVPASYYSMAYPTPSHTMSHAELSGLLQGNGTSGSSGLDYSLVSSSNGQDMMPSAAHGHHTLHHTPNTNAGDLHGGIKHISHMTLPHMASPVPTSPPMTTSMVKHEEDEEEENSDLHSPSSTSSNTSGGHLDLVNGDGDIHNFKMPPKKRQHTIPENQKDDMYWDKRKKNNDSAKRSREARRMKEEQIALRVVFLEQENLQLRTEVSLLKSEIEKLRCMLYNP